MWFRELLSERGSLIDDIVLGKRYSLVYLVKLGIYMDGPRQLKRTKLIAIKNFDEDLYRLVKAYASLEGRTVASIFEEAIRYWIERRRDYDEVRLWVNLDKAYEENLEIVKKSRSQLGKYRDGYALVCDKRLVGVFESYREAAERSWRECSVHALIVKLPYSEKHRELELGLPW